MKKFKRLIALVTVAMFILSLGAPAAFAKTQNVAVDRLNALDVVNGYEDGTFKLDQSITRAEFAVIAVKLLGLNSAVDAAKGATQFSDVAASHWATGFINLASANKVIAGYPDGTFKPEKEVSYAEAITMLVNVLGYGVTVKGSWPTGHIGKAAQIGLLDDVAFADYNEPALRGVVFLAADNALDINVLYEEFSQEQNSDGTTTISYKKGAPLLQERLNVTEYEDVAVTGVAAIQGIKNNQITVGGNTYEAVNLGNFLGLYGLNTNLYLNEDNKIIDVKADEDEIFFDKIKSLDLANDKITFYGAGAVNTVTTVTVFSDYAAATEAALAEGDFGLVVKDSGKVIKFIEANNYTELGIVDSVEDDVVYFTSDPAATDIDLEDVDMDYVQIFKNGEVAELSDIEAGDVVAYYQNGDNYLILATDAVVEGTLNTVAKAAGGTFKLTVDGEAIFSTDDLAYSTDNGDSFTLVDSAIAADLDALNDDVVSEDVTILLSPNGEAAFVVAGQQAAANTIKAVVRNIVEKTDVTGNTNGVTNYIKVTKLDGTEVVYELDNDDYDVDMVTSDYGTLDLEDDGTADINAKELVKLTLSDDGKVTKVAALTTKDMAPANGIDKDNDLIYDDTNAAFVITDDTAIIQVEEYGNSTNYINETDAVDWATVEDNESAVEGYTVTFFADGKEIVLVLIDNDNALSSSKNYGVAVGARYGIGGGDYAIKLMVDGVTNEYVLADAVYDAAYKNEPVTFEMNATGTEISSITNVAADVTITGIDSIKTVGDTLIIVDGTNEYIVKKDKVKYFDNTGAVIEAANGVSKGKNVKLYDFLDKDGDVVDGITNVQDGIYDYVIITD